jgi:hypothetical protein
MPLSFETKTLTVGELFSGSNVFRMPIFQRPFSWDEETALELFGDIDQAMAKSGARSSATYFLGPMIVAQSSSSVPFEIVDGQQRLVTSPQSSRSFGISYRQENCRRNCRRAYVGRRVPCAASLKNRECDCGRSINPCSKSGYRGAGAQCHCRMRVRPRLPSGCWIQSGRSRLR